MSEALLLAIVVLRSISDLAYDKQWDIDPISSRRVYGTVQAVSRLRITVQTIGKMQEIQVYPTHRRLSQGLYPYLVPDPLAYSMQDIRMGDVVTLFLKPVNKVEYCFALILRRRPGGVVPPSRNPRFFAPHSERQNASNAFEDTGRKIPGYLQGGRLSDEYPFADPEVPPEKRIRRFPKDDPFSYMEWVLFMR